MIKYILSTLLATTAVSMAQPIVWENFDACSGNWKQSAVIGTKPSFRAAAFSTVAPLSNQGGCYLSYATADTFHANSTVGWFAQQKRQTWTKRWVNVLMYSPDGGVRVTLDLADDADGDTLTVNDVDTIRSTSRILTGGWQSVNFDLLNDFTDINPTIGNNVRNAIIRSLTFRISTDASYAANDTVRIRVDQIQNSDTTGFVFLNVTPDSVSPHVLAGQVQDVSFYIRNDGDAPSPIRNVTVTGPGAALCTLIHIPTTVGVSGRDSIQLRYSPSVPGHDEATVQFSSDAVNGPSFSRAVHGWADTAIAKSDKFLIFPLTTVGVGQSIYDTAVIRNTGRVPLLMLPIYDSLVGPGRKEYAVISAFHGAIAPGATDSIFVRFTPAFSGNRPASLKLYFRKTMSTVDSVFIGMIGAGGAASINNYPLQVIDSLAVGDSAFYTIRLVNYGSYGVQMQYQTMQGNDVSMFTLVKPLSRPLFPFLDDSIIVRVKPTSLGTKFAYAQLVTDAPNQPIVIVPFTISTGRREIAATPSTVFETDTALVGSTISRQVLCTSVGSLPVRIDSARLVGADASRSFVMWRAPKGTLIPGASDTLGVDFSPTTMGIKIDSIRVYTNSREVPSITVAMRGFAGARRIFLSDSSIVDTVLVEQSRLHCIVVRDSGNLPIVISNIVIGGTDADQFVLVKPAALPHTIPANGTDTICVLLRPTQSGDKIAQMLIQSDAQNNATSVVNLRIQGALVAVQEPWDQPFASRLSATPNPFRDATTLRIDLAPGETITQLGIYDVLGREMQHVSSPLAVRDLPLSFESSPAGVYYVRLATSLRTSSMTVVKTR